MRISIPKSVVRLQVAGVAIALLVTIRTVSGQVTSTVYGDDFGRIGALTGSQPTVDPSGAVWTEHGTNSTDTLIQTNGTAAVFPSGVSANDGRPFTDGSANNREPSLAFTAPADSVVTLSADFTVTSGTGTYGGWLGMGFIDDSVSNPGIFGSAGPTMTLAMDGSVGALASFLTGPTTVYSGNPGVGASDVNLEIVYDNTDPNDITSSFFVNGSGIGTYSYGSTAVPFDEVFLRSYLLGGGTVQDFSLTVTSPVPDYYSSAVLLLIGMGSLVILPLSRPIFRMR